MGLAFYIYTIVILLICAGSGVIALSAYFVSRKKSFLLAMFFFFFYFVDVALIFQFEYVGQNLDFSLERFYAIDYPWVKILIATGVLEALWLIVCDYLDEENLVLKIMPAVLFVLVCSAIVLFMQEGAWQQWLFYTTRQVFLFWCLGFALFRYLRSKNEFYRMRLRRQLPLFIIVLVFVFAITLEDVLMILVWQPSLDTSILPLYISQRNFCENFLVLVFAYYTMKASAAMLRLRFHEPPDPRDNPTIQTHVDDLIPSFCARHSLTGREREILMCILIGKDTQNIASELHLAVGTVKAHVHNILQKTGHETRRELIKDFWRQ